MYEMKCILCVLLIIGTSCASIDIDRHKTVVEDISNFEGKYYNLPESDKDSSIWKTIIGKNLLEKENINGIVLIKKINDHTLAFQLIENEQIVDERIYEGVLSNGSFYFKDISTKFLPIFIVWSCRDRAYQLSKLPDGKLIIDYNSVGAVFFICIPFAAHDFELSGIFKKL